MSTLVKTGTFTANTSTGNQAISGLGFNPTLENSVVIFFTNWAESGQTSTTLAMMCGIAVSSSSRGAFGSRTAHSYSSNAACLINRDNSLTYAKADFVSWDSDGFTINWSTAMSPGRIIHYMVISGADITGLSLNQFTVPATGGVQTGVSQSLTGIGFEADFLLFLTTRTTLDEGGSGVAEFVFSIGAYAANAQRVTAQSYAAGAGTSSRHLNKVMHVSQSTSSTTVRYEASVTSIDPDGFTLLWDTIASLESRKFLVLAIKGPQFIIGNEDQPTTVSAETTAFGIAPLGLMLFSRGVIAGGSNTGNARLVVGMTDGTSENVIHTSGDYSSVETSSIMQFRSTTDNSLQAKAEFDSFPSNGFRLDWTTVNATAHQFWYLAFKRPPDIITFVSSAAGSHRVQFAFPISAAGCHRILTPFDVPAQGYHQVGFDRYQFPQFGTYKSLETFPVVEIGGHRVLIESIVSHHGKYRVLLEAAVSQQGYAVIPRPYSIDQFGIYRSLETFGGTPATSIQQGRHRIQNSGVEGYTVYIGEDNLPDFTSTPSVFSATLPISIPVTPPVSGTTTFYVVMRKRNSYGLESQNQHATSFTVDSDGNLIRDAIPLPLGFQAFPKAGGKIRVTGKYPTVTTDRYPADVWRVWVDVTPPDPLVDVPTAQYSVVGESLVKDLSGYSTGTYYVTIALFRTVDSAQSEAIQTELEYPAAPDQPTAVHTGFDQP